VTTDNCIEFASETIASNKVIAFGAGWEKTIGFCQYQRVSHMSAAEFNRLVSWSQNSTHSDFGSLLQYHCSKNRDVDFSSNQ